MFIGGFFVKDGTPQAATSSRTAAYRYETMKAAQLALESPAQRRPQESYTAVVIDEETMQIVWWAKYEPKPVLEWQQAKF